MTTRPAIADNSESSKVTATRRRVSYAPQRPPAVEEARDLPALETRPTAKQWQTERPNLITKTSNLTPALKRRITNTSLLNEAIWSNPPEDDDDSSSNSSSSSSDDDNDSINDKNVDQKGRDRKRSRGTYSRFNVGNDDFKTKGKVSRKDGRLNISVNETNNRGYLAKALGATFLKHLGQDPEDHLKSTSLTPQASHDHGTFSRESSASTLTSDIPTPRMNIVIMVIGSRGDIQPFLRIGKDLKEFGHRVRLATHPAFKEFVEKDSGLEFFSVGGDPAELMAFMVKNPGMIPKMETLKKGEVGRRRAQMAEMFEGFWRACINATDDERDAANLRMMGEKQPFVADAIIANPPCFAHIHCAERLGIPLHCVFTFPYSATQSFPHPLANIKKTNVDPGYANFMSYPLVEMMTWQGLGDLVNAFRVKTLGLEPVSTLWAPGQMYRLKVPHTYLWSPGLVPKPEDWGSEIDIAGFVFLDLASSFDPPEELVEFLNAGDPPMYIGFGSIVVDDPDRFTEMIFEAVKQAGVRALVSKGWGGLGGDDTPDNIFMLENTPHDWLFPKVSAVVHHGGAGTTAIGLKCGKPTMIVPFFGDQQFWGSMIGNAGAGAMPVPYKSLTAEKLAEGIKQCLTPESRKEAERLAKDIEAEGDGAKNAVTSFHRSLVLRGPHSLRCSILEDRTAVWNLKNTNLRLSALAAELLVEKRKLSWKQLRLIRHNEWNDFEGPGEPLTGGFSALAGSMASAAAGVGSVPFKLARSSRRRTRHEKKKRRKSEQVEARKSAETRRSASESRPMPNGNIPHRVGDPQPERVDHQPDSQIEGQHVKIKGGDKHPGPEDLNLKINVPTENAPLPGYDDATRRPDMDNQTSSQLPFSPCSPIEGREYLGKHTTSGEPISPADGRGQLDTSIDDATQDALGDPNIDGTESVLSADPQENAAEEIAHDVGSGIGQSAGAIARAPMDLSLAVAQGFHNAPRLYGDTTVRR